MRGSQRRQRRPRQQASRERRPRSELESLREFGEECRISPLRLGQCRRWLPRVETRSRRRHHGARIEKQRAAYRSVRGLDGRGDDEAEQQRTSVRHNRDKSARAHETPTGHRQTSRGVTLRGRSHRQPGCLVDSSAFASESTLAWTRVESASTQRIRHKNGWRKNRDSELGSRAAEARRRVAG